MSSSIVIRGNISSHIRKVKNTILSFEVEEGSGMYISKDFNCLIKNARIVYSIFVTKKQLQRIGLDNTNCQDAKLLIHGFITTELPAKYLHGECAVITTSLDIDQAAQKKIG